MIPLSLPMAIVKVYQVESPSKFCFMKRSTTQSGPNLIILEVPTGRGNSWTGRYGIHFDASSSKNEDIVGARFSDGNFGGWTPKNCNNTVRQKISTVISEPVMMFFSNVFLGPKIISVVLLYFLWDSHVEGRSQIGYSYIFLDIHFDSSEVQAKR